MFYSDVFHFIFLMDFFYDKVNTCYSINRYFKGPSNPYFLLFVPLKGVLDEQNYADQ